MFGRVVSPFVTGLHNPLYVYKYCLVACLFVALLNPLVTVSFS
jgi:hypothetical protein